MQKRIGKEKNNLNLAKQQKWRLLLTTKQLHTVNEKLESTINCTNGG
jgi:hypothetical protein